jgi:cytochrome oxidase Cu insertion factor (SCO1/SenC/PrrC family)
MDRFKLWRLSVCRASGRGRSLAACFVIVSIVACLGPCGCNRTVNEPGRYAVTYQTSGLPDLTLIDQYGHQLSLGALNGKSVLFDFIYTSCPGPCQLLTQHMKLIADKLGRALGPKVLFVSVTVDPEHDRPSRLFDYARAFDANRKGWYFLTGSPAQIDQLMSGFWLTRKRDTDGEIDHILGYFLVGPDGHQVVEYSQRVQPSIAARDAEETASRNTLIGKLSFDLRHLI